MELPEQRTASLMAAAKAAGCAVSHPETPSPRQAIHIEKTFKAADYNSNPPTSGPHTPPPGWYEDGVHEPGSVPELGKLVHSLEHGRIHVQYRAGTHAETVAQLTAVTAELEGGYHMLLYENTTDMKPEVAVTTWGHMASCRTMNDNVFDVIRSFRNRYVDKGPEFVP